MRFKGLVIVYLFMITSLYGSSNNSTNWFSNQIEKVDIIQIDNGKLKNKKKESLNSIAKYTHKDIKKYKIYMWNVKSRMINKIEDF